MMKKNEKQKTVMIECRVDKMKRGKKPLRATLQVDRSFGPVKTKKKTNLPIFFRQIRQAFFLNLFRFLRHF